ncbi:MAG TPA: hypothetical protein VM487_17280 [Phycisphaerae bacterium]|nr:hypothetical protein [Phycisphaerae bacterium]
MKHPPGICDSVELVPNELDVRAAKCLQRCSLPPGWWTRRFLGDVCGRILAGETISIRQQVWLWRMAHKFRRQIRDARVVAFSAWWPQTTVNTIEGKPDIACRRGKGGDMIMTTNEVVDGPYEPRRATMSWSVINTQTGEIVRGSLASKSEAQASANQHNESYKRQCAAEQK